MNSTASEHPTADQTSGAAVPAQLPVDQQAGVVLQSQPVCGIEPNTQTPGSPTGTTDVLAVQRGQQPTSAASTTSAPAHSPMLMPAASQPAAVVVRPENGLSPQDCGCGGGSAGPARYVYAFGVLDTKYPSLSVQNEFQQAASRDQVIGPLGNINYEVLSQGQNAYLAREMCFVLRIDGVDSYIVKPRSQVELYEMISTLQMQTTGAPIYSAIIGPLGPLAPPDMCDGLQLPVVVCNQIYSFTEANFVQAVTDNLSASGAITNPTNQTTLQVQDMFQQIMLELTDNMGESDEHRAVNYVALRYPDIYSLAVRMASTPIQGQSLIYLFQRISAMPASVQGTRRVVDVLLHFRERDTGQLVDYYCRVDVTGQFPFLIAKLSRYIPHV